MSSHLISSMKVLISSFVIAEDHSNIKTLISLLSLESLWSETARTWYAVFNEDFRSSTSYLSKYFGWICSIKVSISIIFCGGVFGRKVVGCFQEPESCQSNFFKKSFFNYSIWSFNRSNRPECFDQGLSQQQCFVEGLAFEKPSVLLWL